MQSLQPNKCANIFFFFCMQQAVTAMGTHLALKTSVIELASNSIESTCMGVGHWISLL